MKYIAVIDIGKTHVKVILLQEQKELAVLQTNNQVLAVSPYPHFDIEAIWQFVLDSLSQFIHQYPIDAIITTTHGATAALLDEQGYLALPVLDYEYQDIENLRDEYNQYRPDFQMTGSPILSGGLNLGLQLFWQMRSFPKEFDKVKTLLTYPQYWTFKLTGILGSEITSLGCHTDLWNPHQADYSELVQKIGWLKLMPPLYHAKDIIGTITPEVSQQTGLSQNTLVACGLHDSNASLTPYLLKQQPPFTVISTGTWCIVMSIGGKTVNLDEKRDTLLNVNFLGNPMPSARFMGGREYELLTANNLLRSFTKNDLQTVLQQNLMLLPSVVKGSGPFPNHQSQWVNDSSQVTDSQRYCTISLYLGMMTAICCDLTGGEGAIIIDGPFTQNRLLLQMLASATKKPVLIVQSTGAGLGAAWLLLKTSSLKHNLQKIELPLGIQEKLQNYYKNWQSCISYF